MVEVSQHIHYRHCPLAFDIYSDFARLIVSLTSFSYITQLPSLSIPLSTRGWLVFPALMSLCVNATFFGRYVPLYLRSFQLRT